MDRHRNNKKLSGSVRAAKVTSVSIELLRMVAEFGVDVLTGMRDFNQIKRLTIPDQKAFAT